jgi:hypothetical protein
VQAIPTGTGPIPYSGNAAPAGWVAAHGGSIGDALGRDRARATPTAQPFHADLEHANQSNGEGQVQDSAGTNTARGASAAADFAAHKRILLADMQDRAPRGKGARRRTGRRSAPTRWRSRKANLPAVNFTHSGITLSSIPGTVTA